MSKVLVLSDDDAQFVHDLMEMLIEMLEDDDDEMEVKDGELTPFIRLLQKTGDGEQSTLHTIINEADIEMIADEDMGYHMCNRCFQPIGNVGKDGEEHYLAGHRCGCEEPPEHGWTIPYEEQVPRDK